MLNGHQIGELRDLLCSAFSRSELTMLVRTELDIVLDETVATDEGWRKVVFDLVDTLNRQGREVDLMRAACKARPQNAALIAFCKPFLVNGPLPSGLREAVGTFRASFKDRIAEFQFLNAWKRLHEVLHQVQRYRPQLQASVAARVPQPGSPFSYEVAGTLQEWVTTAQQSVAETEFPDDPPDWVEKFTSAVAVLTGLNPGDMSRAAERLASLPGKELSRVNDKLIDYARRLQAGQLIELLDAVRAALPGGNTTPALATARARVERFRALCDQLADLIRMHDLCQKVDEVLRVARGLPTVTPSQLTDWDDVQRWLGKLTLPGKPVAFRVRRTVEAANQFDAAATQAALLDLLEKFEDLFGNTDENLLMVTYTLPRESLALDAALEKLQ